MDDQPIPQYPSPKYTLSTIFIVAAGLLIALTLAALAFILGDFTKIVSSEQAGVSGEKTEITVASPSADSQRPSANGFITGSLSYPSEGIPADMKVCAVNQQTQAETCTSDHLKTDEGVSYKIEVPVGTYLVYAQLPDQAQKAYYSEFVTCGLMAECPSHAPIPVEVTAGDTANNVDPHDWYTNQ